MFPEDRVEQQRRWCRELGLREAIKYIEGRDRSISETLEIADRFADYLNFGLDEA